MKVPSSIVRFFRRASSPRERRSFGVRRRTVWVQNGIAALCIVVLLAVYATECGVNFLLALAALIFGGLVVDYVVGARSLRGLRVSRKTPEIIRVGEPFYVDVELDASECKKGAWALVVEDEWSPIKTDDAPSQEIPTSRPRRNKRSDDKLDEDELLRRAAILRPTVFFPSIRGGEKLRARYEGVATRRGRRTLIRSTVSTRFPCGFFRSSVRFDIKDEVIVFPRVGELTNAGREFAAGLAREEGDVGARTARAPDEVAFLRDWRDGDSRREIAWRATAKRGRITTREFVARQTRNVALILDLFSGDGAEAVEENVELAISFVATLIDELASRRDARTVFALNADELEDRAFVAVAHKERRTIEWNASDSGARRRVSTRLALARATRDDRLREILEDARRRLPADARVVIVSCASVKRDAADWTFGGNLRRLDVSSPSFSALFCRERSNERV